MAGSVNKVILVGNLGADPEIRRLNSGDSVANLRIATSENWRDKSSGERRERTEWHNVVIFNENLVKVAEQFLKKGSKIYVEGQLQTRNWEDQSGQKRYTTEVVLQRFRGETPDARRPQRRRWRWRRSLRARRRRTWRWGKRSQRWRRSGRLRRRLVARPRRRNSVLIVACSPAHRAEDG